MASTEPTSHRLPMIDLHREFMGCLGNKVLRHSPVELRPLDLDLAVPLPPKIRVYLYNATQPRGGRSAEYKIQLRINGQARRERASFDHTGGRIVYLVGYVADLGVYILWDSWMYSDFAYSRNVQVKPDTVNAAFVGQISFQERSLSKGQEIVIASKSTDLNKALLERQNLTMERLNKV